MGGGSKNLGNVEVAAVVDLILDDVDTDESYLFHALPDNDESDDDDELQSSDIFVRC